MIDGFFGTGLDCFLVVPVFIVEFLEIEVELLNLIKDVLTLLFNNGIALFQRCIAFRAQINVFFDLANRHSGTL